MGLVAGSGVLVVEISPQQRKALAPVGDIGDRRDQTPFWFEEGLKLFEYRDGIHQMFQDMREENDVKGGRRVIGSPSLHVGEDRPLQERRGRNIFLFGNGDAVHPNPFLFKKPGVVSRSAPHIEYQLVAFCHKIEQRGEPLVLVERILVLCRKGIFLRSGGGLHGAPIICDSTSLGKSGVTEAMTELNSILFSPFTLKTLQLRNRVVMAPMTRCFSPAGVPTEAVAEYYARHAAGGVGLIVTEGTQIDHPSAPGYPNVPNLFGEAAMNGWRRVVESVHARDGAIFAQLWHCGSFRKPDFDKERLIPCVAPSAVMHPGMVPFRVDLVPHALTEDEISDVVSAYARSAKNAEAAGFDGVEIHGAHGYLIDAFFWEKTNLRTDKYGGSLENRVRFASEVVRAIRRAVSPDFIVGFRFSQWKAGDYEEIMATTPGQLQEILVPLASAGVDCFHASTYRFFRPAFADFPLTLAGWTRKLTSKVVIAVGGVGVSADFREERQGQTAGKQIDLEPLARLLGKEFDLIALGRALLGDAEWPNKVKVGNLESISAYSKKVLGSL